MGAGGLGCEPGQAGSATGQAGQSETLALVTMLLSIYVINYFGVQFKKRVAKGKRR